jgi:hypothetical protein
MNNSQYTIGEKDMQDFRIPLDTYREYSSIMKGLNRDCQNSFLTAIGVETGYSKAKVSWEMHIQLMCLLKFDNCTMDEQINFFKKVMDPHKKGMVPKDQFEFTLRSLFKGQF